MEIDSDSKRVSQVKIKSVVVVRYRTGRKETGGS